MRIQGIDAIFTDSINSTPIGSIWIAQSVDGVVAIQIGGKGKVFSQSLATKFGCPIRINPTQTENIASEIKEFLHGARKTFKLKIHWGIMSPFQQKALKAVMSIPYGETRTYGQIAAEIGIPRAPRAVGRANATNPMPLVIPCHRLIGADGSLRGYGGGEGIKTKRWLLDLEKHRSC